MIHYETLRKKLHQRRLDLNMTQADVARKIGIQVGSFNQLELGLRLNPTTETLAAWCKALEAYLIIDADFYFDERQQ